jgi:Fe2+ transport system protein FeoA
VDVNPSRTTIGRWLMARGRRGLQGAAELAATGLPAPGQNRLTLVDVPVGWSARIAGIEGPLASRKQQLRAYGLLSGDWIRVIQHTPTSPAAFSLTRASYRPTLRPEIGLVGADSVAGDAREHETSASDNQSRANQGRETSFNL